MNEKGVIMNMFNLIFVIIFIDVYKIFKDKEYSVLKGILGIVM